MVHKFTKWMTPSLHFHAYVGVQHCYHFDYNTPWVKMNPSAKFYPVGPAVYPPTRNIVVVFLLTEMKQEVKVIWQKAPHGGPIPRLGVTLGGRKLYHWIPGVGFPISVP